MKVDEIQNVVMNGLCLGCGFCTVSVKGQRLPNISIGFSAKYDHFIPTVQGNKSYESDEVVCPGAEIDMLGLSSDVYGGLPGNYMLGALHRIRVSYAKDEVIREKSASGGLIPVILRHLFDAGQIESAYLLHPGSSPYGAEGKVIYDAKELSEIHGSVYHPTNFGENLYKLFSDGKKFAFVGVPCQIAGLEMLKASNEVLKKNHVLSIGLFCGGVNTFRGIAYYLKGFGVPWDKVENIRYRHGYWPGKILIEMADGERRSRLIPRIRGNSRWKILRYVIAFQGYWMMKRCRLCPDQINDFADIAVGDPHLPRYRKSNSWGYSLVLTRSDRGEKLVSQLEKEECIISEPADEKTVTDSQGYALDNRRHVMAYYRVNNFLGNENPRFRLYPEAVTTTSLRHFVYAWVDLIKIVLPKNALLSALYIPWQIFEYLFITFTPAVIYQRLKKLIKNK